MRLTGFYLTDEQIKERVDHFRYVRTEDKKPIGVVVLDRQGRIGWSLYNEDCEYEEASTDKGLLIALNRAVAVADPERDLQKRIIEVAGYRKLDNSRLVFTIAVVREMKSRLLDAEELK